MLLDVLEISDEVKQGLSSIASNGIGQRWSGTAHGLSDGERLNVRGVPGVGFTASLREFLDEELELVARAEPLQATDLVRGGVISRLTSSIRR